MQDHTVLKGACEQEVSRKLDGWGAPHPGQAINGWVEQTKSFSVGAAAMHSVAMVMHILAQLNQPMHEKTRADTLTCSEISPNRGPKFYSKVLFSFQTPSFDKFIVAESLKDAP